MTAKVLNPIAITGAMITASAVAEPDTTRGEAAWVAATSYVVGNEVILASTHRVYTALAAGVDAGSPDVTPLRWADTRPTNKFAAFDLYKSTQIRKTGTITMTVKPGIISDMAFYGLEGDTLRVIAKQASTLAVYYDETFSLSDYLSGDLMWEFYFGVSRQQDRLDIMGLYPQDAQVEITLTVSPTTGDAAIGIWALGQFEDLGLPQYGFKVQFVDYSRITTDAYGNVSITRGLNAKNLNGECVNLDLVTAKAAVDVVQRLLGTPCAVVMSSNVNFDYLSTFGLLDAEFIAAGPSHGTLSLTARGIV